jgi:hypothetical protein
VKCLTVANVAPGDAALPTEYVLQACILLRVHALPCFLGEGRVHHCLRVKRDLISDRCREEEMKLQAIEYKDIRLRPKLAKVCSEERSVYCKVRVRRRSYACLRGFWCMH